MSLNCRDAAGIDLPTHMWQHSVRGDDAVNAEVAPRFVRAV
jgi:hypothetical protein